MPAPQHQLEYAPRPRRSRAVMVRRVVLAGLAVFVMVAGIKWGPVAWQHLQVLQWQNKCMTYRPGPDEVAYGAQPGDTRANLPWNTFYAHYSPPGLGRYEAIFVGELRNRHGSRLVAVGIGFTSLNTFKRFPEPMNTVIFLDAEIIEPGGVLWRPKVLTGRLGPQSLLLIDAVEPVRIYAGQRDPANPAHFTIRVTSNAATSHIDGWLTDDDKIVMETRK